MAHHDTDFWSDADHRYLERRRARRRRIDPFYARVIALAAVGILLIPVALTLRQGSDTNVLHTSPNGGGAVAIPGGEHTEPTASSIAATTTALPFVADSVEPSTIPTTVPESSTTAAPSTAAPTTDVSTTAVRETAASTTPPVEPTAVSATVKAAPPTLAPRSCTNSYTVVAGDSWTRVAQRAGVKLPALLEANGATADTTLFPGNKLCLPAGATTTRSTTPPTTARASAPPAPPATTTAPKPSATTTPATAAPTTAAPPAAAPANTYSRAEVIEIIRATWPDHLEDKAIAVATRESSLNPTVRNYCCYGLFQIYFSVHKSWLAGMGVTSASELYDPHTNTAAALALYQRSGGWGPWGG